MRNSLLGKKKCSDASLSGQDTAVSDDNLESIVFCYRYREGNPYWPRASTLVGKTNENEDVGVDENECGGGEGADSTNSTHMEEEEEEVVSYRDLHRLLFGRRLPFAFSKTDERRSLSLTWTPSVPGSSSCLGRGDDGFSTGVVVVAVSVPEGPWMAVAVLAVHLSCGGDCDGAILVPIDPEREGPERLRILLSDARPDYVLCVGGTTHWARMKTAIASVVEPTLADRTTMVDVSQWPEDMFPNDHDQEEDDDDDDEAQNVVVGNEQEEEDDRRVSHLVYTSGTTGRPKGCVCSVSALRAYVRAKNTSHGITCRSRVGLTSTLPFDPCLSDVIATYHARATLVLLPHSELFGMKELRDLRVTHVLCTPSFWWNVMEGGDDCDDGKEDWFGPYLQMVALGGEPIPHRLVHAWTARRQQGRRRRRGNFPRLCATYGTTEACVYQTLGDVDIDVHSNHKDETTVRSGSHSHGRGQDVGYPLDGTVVGIHPENEKMTPESVRAMPVLNGRNQSQSDNPGNDVDNDTSFPIPVVGEIGEIVVSGRQLDHTSGYWNLPDHTRRAFVRITDGDNNNDNNDHDTVVWYRTGDRGYLCGGRLVILGRTDRCVKVNGVRLELGDVEAAIMGENHNKNNLSSVISDCLAVVNCHEKNDVAQTDGTSEVVILTAYVVLTSHCFQELGVSVSSTGTTTTTTTDDVHTGDDDNLTVWTLPSDHPLTTLLRVRCGLRLRAGCTPRQFAVLSKMPLAPTGKRATTVPASAIVGEFLGPWRNDCRHNDSEPLKDRGRSGAAVAAAMNEVLSIGTTTIPWRWMPASMSFAALGGDSLSAARVVRKLYARHKGVRDSRHLGGPTGVLTEEGTNDNDNDKSHSDVLDVFRPIHLLRAYTVGDYVDFLDRHGVLTVSEEGDRCDRCDRLDIYDDPNDVENTSGILDNAKNDVWEKEEKKEVLVAADHDEDNNNDDDDFLAWAPTDLEDDDTNPSSVPSATMSTINQYEGEELDKALLKALAHDMTMVALGLLELGADPNGGGRQGTVNHRLKERHRITTRPLHLACLRGNDRVVEDLLERAADPTCPDPSGLFPLHLTCLGHPENNNDEWYDHTEHDHYHYNYHSHSHSEHSIANDDEDHRRCRILRRLLASTSVSLTTVVGRSRQTVLHVAARSRRPWCPRLWDELLERWPVPSKDVPVWGLCARHRYEWQDRWFRTPLHWAVLHGNVPVVRRLLEAGCRVDPPRPRVGVHTRRTGAIVESPLDTCVRVHGRQTRGHGHGPNHHVGEELYRLLLEAATRDEVTLR